MNIVFVDTEVSKDLKTVQDYGAVTSFDQTVHTKKATEFIDFIKNADYLCGHNIIHFDWPYIKKTACLAETVNQDLEEKLIDTLYLSPLLFPKRPYHALLKDDKIITEEKNNPVNDSKKARDLFYSEVEAFRSLSEEMKRIYFALLGSKTEFGTFFRYMNYHPLVTEVESEIRVYFSELFCENADLDSIIQQYPVELAYCLALIQVEDEYSITPGWVLRKYPLVDTVMTLLRQTPCEEGCSYCRKRLDAKQGLKQFFGYDSYREFDGVALQEKAVTAALHNKSILVVFPTGGGKSITFQVPALMAGRNERGLTIVISPLQSLMKDQVDNLERVGITDAVTINGLLDPIERTKAIERVRDGNASILYISPESLRSRTIHKLLRDRKIVRFVIDEAHCFSAWGQDFRVDYLYIAEFIKKLCEEKNLNEMIPVSCFTATAKQNVIEDICNYFKENLNLEMELFTASSARKNLTYKVIAKEDADKYATLRELLEYKKCPTIIYVSRTRRAEELAANLTRDGYQALAYHGKMDKKVKSQNQEAFTNGEASIMVATSAFGMGVDKKDVGMVIHYNISDSLENYVQEAGRAGRDQAIEAECFVLFNEEDLNKHFQMLNQTKITINEIQQVWRAIKKITNRRKHLSGSALEIAREAGWDESVENIQTKVVTAVQALEDAGYVKRGENSPHVYADSILAQSVIEAAEKIRKSSIFSEHEQEQAIRMIRMMIASRSRQRDSDDLPESRVDYMADVLGMQKSDVLARVQQLRDANILSDSKDLTAYMDESRSTRKNMNALLQYIEIERFLFEQITEDKEIYNVKELNETAKEKCSKKCSPDAINRVLNYWSVHGFVTRMKSKHSKNLIKIQYKKERSVLEKMMTKRFDIAGVILLYLDGKSNDDIVQFSVLELCEHYNSERQMISQSATTQEIEEALYYMNKIDALKIEGGFLVSYQALSIDRLEMDNKIRYKVDDYRKLKLYYEQKTQMIHIVGEYAKRLMKNYRSALDFVEDYFSLDYDAFLKKYFDGVKKDDISRNLTPQKFKQLFGTLSPTQLEIIQDRSSQYIVVGAGPGSGKTRILVHKLASLLLMEDVKSEDLLMLTFSRASATEFKKRLVELIGKAANFVEIKTFHSYCFDLLGEIGTVEKSGSIVKMAAEAIDNREVELSRITKSVLVIDEAQDMDQNEFKLIQALIKRNEDMRVIAVGDDDQNIYSFRGSDSRYMQQFLQYDKSHLYELVENYRSKANIVEFSNVFGSYIKERLKTMYIIPHQNENGMVKIYEYKTKDFLYPAVQRLGNYSTQNKKICFLTTTNEEALFVLAQLEQMSVKASLIQGSEQFNLSSLAELRYFVEALELTEELFQIDYDRWNKAKQKLFRRYHRSSMYPLCTRLLADFETVNPQHKYVSDFLIYLKESREEDFAFSEQASVYVSTIHKSKGREFDQVILLLNNFYLNQESNKRELYVGLTRAKDSLTIHTNQKYFSSSYDFRYTAIEGVDYFIDPYEYPASNLIRIELGYYDIYLSYFYRNQEVVKQLLSGDMLIVDRNGCYDRQRRPVVLFSKHFKEIIQEKEEKGYHICAARIRAMFYWHQQDVEDEVLIVMPTIDFKKE